MSMAVSFTLVEPKFFQTDNIQHPPKFGTYRFLRDDGRSRFPLFVRVACKDHARGPWCRDAIQRSQVALRISAADSVVTSAEMRRATCERWIASRHQGPR